MTLLVLRHRGEEIALNSLRQALRAPRLVRVLSLAFRSETRAGRSKARSRRRARPSSGSATAIPPAAPSTASTARSRVRAEDHRPAGRSRIGRDPVQRASRGVRDPHRRPRSRRRDSGVVTASEGVPLLPVRREDSRRALRSAPPAAGGEGPGVKDARLKPPRSRPPPTAPQAEQADEPQTGREQQQHLPRQQRGRDGARPDEGAIGIGAVDQAVAVVVHAVATKLRAAGVLARRERWRCSRRDRRRRRRGAGWRRRRRDGRGAGWRRRRRDGRGAGRCRRRRDGRRAGRCLVGVDGRRRRRGVGGSSVSPSACWSAMRPRLRRRPDRTSDPVAA